MSATWPRPFRCCGPIRKASRPSSMTARSDWPKRSTRLRRSAAPTRRRVLAEMLDHLDASGRFALLKLATGALRVGHFRAPRQAGAGRRLRARRRAGRGSVARVEAALRRAVRLGRRPRAAADRHAIFPCSGRSCSPTRWKSARFARRLCRRVEVGRDPRPAGPCRRTNAALQPHRRRYFGQFSRHCSGFRPAACSTANCWFAGEVQGAESMAARGELQCACSSGSAASRQRQDAGPVSGVRPSLRYTV